MRVVVVVGSRSAGRAGGAGTGGVLGKAGTKKGTPYAAMWSQSVLLFEAARPDS